MNRKACSIVFFLCLFTGLGCLGNTRPDSVPYMLKRFGNSSGLPQNSAKSIARDPYGFIWVATEDGLARFDGESFVAFRMADLGLSSTRIINFYTNAQGELACFSEHNEDIRLVDGRPTVDSNLQNRSGNYTVWHSTTNIKDTIGKRLMGLPLRLANWSVNTQKQVLYTGSRSFFTCTKNMVSYYRDSMHQFSIPFTPDSSWNFVLISGSLYFLHQSGMVSMFGKQLQTAPLEGDIRKDPLFRKGSREMIVYWNGYIQGNVIIRFNDCFYLVEAGRDGRLFTRLLFTGFNVAATNITCAYYSAEQGKLFLGSAIKGLYILSAQQFITRGGKGPDAAYYGQAAVGPGEVLTGQGDLIGTDTPPRVIGLIRQMIPTDYYSMLTDTLGNVFIKWSEWLYKYEKGTYRLLKSWKLPAGITCIYDDGEGLLWIGVKEKGLSVMPLYKEEAEPADFLSMREDITYIAKQQHTIYTATGIGMYKIDMGTKHIDTIDGLRGKYVRSLLALPGEEIWLTTYGHGFFRYHNNKLTAFPLDQHEYLAITHCIVPDNNGFMWLTTNNGLFQVSRADLLAYADDSTITPYYHYYNKQDGFSTNEFNGGCQPCAVRLENGYVSLPSLNGLVFFKPDSMRPLLPGPHLFIDRIELDKQTLAPTGDLQLPRDFRQLNIFLSSPNMTNSLNLHIRYALVKEGEEPLWLPLVQKQQISISTLPHGTYHLLIRKWNGFGRDNFTEKSILLQVPPAWYQTRLFYVACLLGSLGCFYLLMRLRVRYAEERNRALEAAVALKTKELQRRTDIQEKIIRSVSHDIQTPLQYQHLLSGKIYEDLRDRQADMAPAARVMHEHTHRLYYMVDNLLKYLKVEVADQPRRIERFELAPMVNETVMIFSGPAAEKGTTLHNHIPAGLEMEGDTQLISVILHNLTDNAVKITRNGNIDIDAEPEGNGVCITIRDTGPGLNPAIQQWINTPGATQESMQLVNGIGLMIVKELVTMLKLEIGVVAEKGQGTCFRIRC